jgi:hypothetical protein
VALASGQGKVRHVRVRKGYPESGSNEGTQANKGKSFAPRRDTVTQTKVGIEIAEILATVSVVPASVIYKSLTFSSSNTVQTHPSSQILIMQGHPRFLVLYPGLDESLHHHRSSTTGHSITVVAAPPRIDTANPTRSTSTLPPPGLLGSTSLLRHDGAAVSLLSGRDGAATSLIHRQFWMLHWRTTKIRCRWSAL